MDPKPHIDIIVPTYNRPNDIKKFINEIQKQFYPYYKVYIIDDASVTSIKQIIPENKHFYYERLKTNSGQAFVRNYAVNKGNGDFLVFMDDDAWFTQENHLSKVADNFIKNPQAGCLMFDIKEPNRPLLSTRKNLNNNQEIGDFIACGCAFTRKAFEETKGFSELFHSYGEETDIAIQLIEKGYKTVFAKDILVYHNYLPGKRTKKWKRRFIKNSVRNDLLIVSLRFPWFLIFPYLILKFGSHLAYNIKQEKNIHYPFIGLISFFQIIFTLLKNGKREPMSFFQFRHWLKVRM